MKSLVSIVHTAVEHLLADAARAYPSLRTEFERDKHRLTSLVSNRGLGLFTLDLPSLDGVLTDALEVGRLTLDGPLTRPVSKGIRVPVLFRGLWLRVFDNSGSLRLDADPTAISFLRHIMCFGKKLTLQCTPARNLAAIKEFVDVERTMRRPSLDWESDAPFDRSRLACLSFGSLREYESDTASPALFEDDRERVSEADAYLLERLDTICRDVSTRFGLFDPVAYESKRLVDGRPSGTKNGPGAVSDRTAKQEKFHFAYWPEKLQRVFPIDFFGHSAQSVCRSYTNLEHPSKLILVPKTAKTPRLIASEPSYHQWCQQLVLSFLVDGIKDVFKGRFISLEDQSKSHPLVHSASLNRLLATVDLSAASDRLSCWTVERVFAKNLSLLDAFHAVRTRVIGRSRSADIDFAFLRKFSTMGSALTFPVQSIVFTCIALASLPGPARLDDMICRYGDQVRVFGDDIIVPVTGYANLVRLLTLLGLKVNTRKSFSSGYFRESCGFDAFKGYDVTPSKPQSLSSATPVGRKSLIDVSNNLFLNGFWLTSNYLLSLLPEVTQRALPVTGLSDRAGGLASFCGTKVDHLRSRYNSRLHRTEVLCTSYTSKVETTQTDGTDYSTQALHSLHSRKAVLPVFASPSRSVLGRVVKAVTRERRSWEVIDTVLCPDASPGGIRRKSVPTALRAG